MRRLAITIASVLLLVTACGSSGPAGGSPAHGSTARSAAAVQGPHITIKNFGYTGTMTVKPGAKVTVTNEDSTAHTLTDKRSHKFDTGNIAADGGTGTFTAPTAPGSYPFGCTYHPDMRGTLVVQG